MVQVINTVEKTDVDHHEVEAVNKAENRPLYAARIKIHPKDVAGTFRRLKWILLVVLLGIYYITPWIRWDRGPGAPDQAVLIDMANRRFYFFFIEIWPQEFYYVAGLLIMAGVGLFLATSMFGRIWCGYACPQTVWTDLFM
ncbi:MAG: 4Fe-4S binding protein, partial [Hyphomicrobiales bacterium]